MTDVDDPAAEVDDPGFDLDHLARRLGGVPGVVGVVLGGSRAAGTARPGSDTDLGLYYRGSADDIDVAALRLLVREVAGPQAEVTDHGGWGPWVDGGGWLSVDGHPVDLLYRDLDRVEACWEEVRTGRYSFGTQTGHPLGFLSLAYPGELALGRVLHDPSGVLAVRHAAFGDYPPALAEAVVAGLGEADFLLSGVAKAADRDDPAYLALCLSRIVLLAAHAVCARAGRWVVNEKGLVAVAAAQPTGPPGFADVVADVLGHVVDDGPGAVDRARDLLAAVHAAVDPPRRWSEPRP